MQVPVGLKVGAFALVVMGGYSWFANSIPQIESKPPQELSLEGGNVTQPLIETFFSPAFGMCTDRFGTPWMVSAEGQQQQPPQQ